MRILYRWLDYCQSHDVDVYFTEMWPDAKWLVRKNMMKTSEEKLTSAPSDFDAWAEGYSHLLEYLVKEKKYTCIKWASVCNEPMESWGWWRNSDTTQQDIIAGIIPLQKKLAEKNIPVQLVSTDGPIKYDLKGFDEYLPFIGAISFHDYGATYDWWKNKPFISDDVDAIRMWKEYGKKNGNKPVFMAEFGTMMFGFTKDTAAPSPGNRCFMMCRWSSA